MNNQINLPLEKIEKALIYLPNLASLIAQSNTLQRDTIKITLQIKNHIDDECLDELFLWSTILVNAQNSTVSEESSLEAFKNRGVFQGPAILAIKKVLGTNKSAQPIPSTPLSMSAPTTQASAQPIMISPEELNFGDIAESKKSIEYINVHGGPGNVIVDSDYIEVEPNTFGPGSTTIKVTMANGKVDELVWDKIILKNSEEDRVISVTARWIIKENKNPLGAKVLLIVASCFVATVSAFLVYNILSQADQADKVFLKSKNTDTFDGSGDTFEWSEDTVEESEDTFEESEDTVEESENTTSSESNNIKNFLNLLEKGSYVVVVASKETKEAAEEEVDNIRARYPEFFVRSTKLNSGNIYLDANGIWAIYVGDLYSLESAEALRSFIIDNLNLTTDASLTKPWGEWESEYTTPQDYAAPHSIDQKHRLLR